MYLINLVIQVTLLTIKTVDESEGGQIRLVSFH